MAYGDTVAPRIFQDDQPHAYTVTTFMRDIYKALLAMGFRPLVSWGFMFQDTPVEMLTNDDGWLPGPNALPDNRFFRHPAIFMDFPEDVEDFEDANGVMRRPTLEIRYSFDALNSTDFYITGAGYMISALIVDVRMRDVSIDPASHWYSAGTGNALWESIRKARGLDTARHNNGFASTSYQKSDYFPNSAGNFSVPLFVQLYPNELYDGSQVSAGQLAARVARFAVRNIFLSLTPAGFLFQVGAGNRKTDNNDRFNIALVFSGKRIPGRGVALDEDLDLAETSPIFYHSLNSNENNDGYFSDTAAFDYRLNGVIYGARFTQADGSILRTSGAVVCRSYAIENLDLADRTVRDRMVPLNSPRVVGDATRHVLSPLVTSLNWQVYAGAPPSNLTYYSPLNPGYSTTIVLPRWRDLFFTDKVVITDSSAPAGIFPDPTTGKQYYLSRMRAQGAMIGFDITGYTEAAYVAPTHTLLDTTTIDVSSGTLISTGPVTITESGHDGNWVYGGSGVITRTWTTEQTGIATFWQFNVDADPLDRFYVLEFEYRHRGATVNDGPRLTELSNTQRQQYYNNPLRPVCLNAAGGSDWAPLVGDILGCAGTQTTDRNYDWRTVRFFLRRAQGANKNIYFNFFTWSLGYPSGQGSKVIEMRNFAFKRYQFQY